MDELKWELLAEIQGRAEAEIFKSFLVANGVEDVELFQESVGQSVYPTMLDMLGRVQVFVPKEILADAQKLLEEFQQAEFTNTEQQDNEEQA